MRPRDSAGRLWTPIDCNNALQGIRAIVVNELRDRDYSRGIPRSGQVYRVVQDGVNQRTEIDPDLSKRKHTGDETQRVLQARWREFCAEPRDPVVELEKFGKTSTPEAVQRMHMAGLDQTIEAAIARGIEAGLRAATQTKGTSDAKHERKPVDKRGREQVQPATAGNSQDRDAADDH